MSKHRQSIASIRIDPAQLVAPLFYADWNGGILWADRPSPVLVEHLRPAGPGAFAGVMQRFGKGGSSALRGSLHAQLCHVQLDNGMERLGCIPVVDPDVLEQAEQRWLLAEETVHRSRNILTIVSTIAAQTLAGHLPDASLNAFQDRLRSLQQALTAACDVTSGECDVVEIVARVIARFCQPDDVRVRCSGPAAKLSATWATSLAMALHELSTNALKYGALSVTGGTVAVEWRREGGSAAPTLCLSWRERGGPAVCEPARSGFGLRLIQRVLGTRSRCAAVIDFAPAGLVCRIRLPLRSEDEPPSGA